MAKKNIESYSQEVLPHLEDLIDRNNDVMSRVSSKLVKCVKKNGSLFIFGSGHSALTAMEFYHRAGGPSFVIPVVADYLLPIAGPPIVRLLERTPGVVSPLLMRAKPRRGDMLWIFSQSGINSAAIDLAMDASKYGILCVAFTSLTHSKSVKSRHASGKRLFEICDDIVDLGGRPGDAMVKISDEVFAGPLSTLSGVLLGHSILVSAMSQLEADGVRCVYTSVNTRNGEKRNAGLEKKACIRDPLLR
ncbi:MAG: sugar isomerase domain-containing protein [Bdellovibrionota bacterium]